MADQTFRLPDLGEGLTEAQLVAWRVEEGGRVDVNTPLCEVETAKAVVVIPSPWAGTIQKLHARPGESVAVGEALVTITAADAAQAMRARLIALPTPPPGEAIFGRVYSNPPESFLREREEFESSLEGS
jgi:2-oxoisovalerate dehydrogenase E2 component (dihydrolipoyl transacylase)